MISRELVDDRELALRNAMQDWTITQLEAFLYQCDKWLNNGNDLTIQERNTVVGDRIDCSQILKEKRRKYKALNRRNSWAKSNRIKPSEN